MSGSYSLFLPLDDRHWITANQRVFWAVRWKRTREWREEAGQRARIARLPHLDQALVICELQFSTQRRRDPANWAPTAKAIVDGLVDAGIFDDDDHRHVIGPDMRIGNLVDPVWEGVLVHLKPSIHGAPT